MSRNVCSSRSRCRRLIGRTTLFAFPLAVSTGSLTAQSTVPFQPGLGLTYVMRNLSDTADREFTAPLCRSRWRAAIHPTISRTAADLGLTATSTGITTDGDLSGDVATTAKQMTQGVQLRHLNRNHPGAYHDG